MIDNSVLGFWLPIPLRHEREFGFHAPVPLRHAGIPRPVASFFPPPTPSTSSFTPTNCHRPPPRPGPPRAGCEQRIGDSKVLTRDCAKPQPYQGAHNVTQTGCQAGHSPATKLQGTTTGAATPGHCWMRRQHTHIVEPLPICEIPLLGLLPAASTRRVVGRRAATPARKRATVQNQLHAKLHELHVPTVGQPMQSGCLAPECLA